MNLLIIDDDKDLLRLLELTFKKEYNVDLYDSAEKIVPEQLVKYNLIILDVMMDKMDGFEFLSRYRELIDAPIILLTAKSFEKDKIEGFALGADDYVTKPFSVSEIRARVAAHIRRENRDKHIRIIDYPISCDLLSKKIYFKKIEIALTRSEYEICELLLKNRNQVFTKEKIYTTIYGYDAEGDSSTSITERIKKIREKFAGFHINPVKTIWGVGYQWEVKKSLNYLISKFAILELFFALFMSLFSYFLINVLINTGVVYPANYAEINSDTVKYEFLKENWKTDKIPFFYEYQLRDNGEIVQNTIDERYNQKISEALQKGKSLNDKIIGSDVFKALKNGNKNLIIKYKISAIPTNPNVYKIIRNFDLVYFPSMFCLWLIGFIYLINNLTRELKSEIRKISKSNDNIEKLQLEFEREYSDYAEISGVLDSIDSMARSLKASLEKQWNMQMTQKEMIESITHDVRTPITLIKGNIELLKEDQENVLERAENALNGVERLEFFLKKLNEFSDLMQAPKEVVSREVLDDWIKIVTSICKLKGFSLSILSYDTSNIKLDKNSISIAIQNLVNNAIENSSVGSTIFISFYDDIDDYTIVVRDQGDGFNNDILYDLREKYVSMKMYDSNIHGLGLSIVTKILETNKGELLLKNYDDQGNGAEVKMVFKK